MSEVGKAIGGTLSWTKEIERKKQIRFISLDCNMEELIPKDYTGVDRIG